MPSKPRVALYLRCSDARQETSVQDQRTECVKYATKHGYKIVDEYVDDGISGDATEKRTGFLQMREVVGSGTFDIVLCWKECRFGRFDLLDAGYWTFPFRKAGVQLFTVTDGHIDWETFEGRLLYGVRTEQKNKDLKDLSQNVLRGQHACALNGSWIGSAPYGYVIVGPKKQKRLALGDEAKVQAVVRIFDEYVNGDRNQSHIARGLEADGVPSPKGNDWGLDAIRTILRNEAYIGTYRFNKYSRAKYAYLADGVVTKGARKGWNPESDVITHEKHHDAIISAKLFKAAQAKLAQRRQAPRGKADDESTGNLLSGVLFCGACGGRLHVEDRDRGAYECSNRKGDRKLCEGMRVREKDVLLQLAFYFEDNFLPFHQTCRINLKKQAGKSIDDEPLSPEYRKLYALIAGHPRSQNNPQQLTKRIAALKPKISQARRNLTFIENPANIPSVEAEIAAMEEQLRTLQAQRSAQPTDASVRHVIDTIWECWDGLLDGSPKQVRKVVRHLDRITVFTKVSGAGTGIRHTLDRAIVVFRPSGVTMGESNPQRPG